MCTDSCHPLSGLLCRVKTKINGRIGGKQWTDNGASALNICTLWCATVMKGMVVHAYHSHFVLHYSMFVLSSIG